MGWFLGDILELLYRLWDADDRPDARQFTLGCGAVLLIAAAVAWWFWPW
jgi:hypothetical protein